MIEIVLGSLCASEFPCSSLTCDLFPHFLAQFHVL